MPAAKYKIKIEQGATYRKQFTWKAGGVPVDLTGYTGRMQIRPDVTSSTIIADLTTENDGITIEANGVFNVFISATDTANLNFDTAVYDLELIAPSGDVQRMLEGDVSLSLEVTR